MDNSGFFEFPASLMYEYGNIKAVFGVMPHILAIRDVDSKLFSLTAEEKLAACGIANCSVQYYGGESEEVNTPGDHLIGGQQIAVQRPNERIRSVILIRSDFPPELQGITLEATKVCVLFHELGHADDLLNQINFNDVTKMCDMEKSELYADAFAEKMARRIRCLRYVAGTRRGSNLGEWYAINKQKREFTR